MSRIHTEALQRAYLERGKAPVSGELQVVEPPATSSFPPVTSGFDEPPIVRAEVALENVAERIVESVSPNFVADIGRSRAWVWSNFGACARTSTRRGMKLL